MFAQSELGVRGFEGLRVRGLLGSVVRFLDNFPKQTIDLGTSHFNRTRHDNLFLS